MNLSSLILQFQDKQVSRIIRQEILPALRDEIGDIIEEKINKIFDERSTVTDSVHCSSCTCDELTHLPRTDPVFEDTPRPCTALFLDNSDIISDSNEGKLPSASDIKLPSVSDIKLTCVSDIKPSSVSDSKLTSVSDIKLSSVSDSKLSSVADIKLTPVSDIKDEYREQLQENSFSNPIYHHKGQTLLVHTQYGAKTMRSETVDTNLKGFFYFT